MAAPTFDEILRHLGETGERAKPRANTGLDQGERWVNPGLNGRTIGTTLAHVSPALARPEPAPMAAISPLAPLALATEEQRPIPPDLDRLIRRAATYWGYSTEDLATIQQAARRDPEGLRLALEDDVAFRLP